MLEKVKKPVFRQHRIFIRTSLNKQQFLMAEQPYIPVNEPLLDGNEKKYLMECIDSGWISSEGPFVERFEQAFARRVGRKHAIAVANGSLALDAAVVALRLGPGDEVIMPSFTIISCAAAVVRAGAVPVLVDSDPHTWNMDVTQLAAKITPRTRAIMVVHIYGLPVDMDPVLALAQQYDLAVIEDAAEMHGQTYKNQPCGSFGDISIFSFYPNKHVTTGEGGMLVTDDAQLAERCRSLRNLCFQPQQRFLHEELGWNMRMTNLQAAVGLAQLERLDEFILRKRRMGQIYQQHLTNLPQVQLPLARTNYADNIYWVFGLVADLESGTAKFLMQELQQQKIGTRPFFWPMHEQPVFQRMGLFNGESYPVAENLARQGFYLPSGMALDEQQIITSADALRRVLNHLSGQKS
jgi:perosamine synthetase